MAEVNSHRVGVWGWGWGVGERARDYSGVAAERDNEQQ